MKKLTMILLLALLVGAVMAKPPTKQEKKAHKQAEIAAVLDVIKAGRFIIYEPNYNKTHSPGDKFPITVVDVTDTTYTEVLEVFETDKIYKIQYSSKTISNYLRTSILYYYKNNGYIKVEHNERNGGVVKSALYTDVVKLID